MGEHFGVGFGSEMMCRLRVGAAVLERLVIFDHAVVDERELAALVEMRMGILIGRFAVRGPAGVADAVGAGRRIVRRSIATSPAMRPAHLRVST